MTTEIAALSPVQEEAIRQMIDIDGWTWEAVSRVYGISVTQVREAWRRARASAESRFGTRSEMWRDQIVMMCLDVAGDAQECFEKSKKSKKKRVRKSTPQGDVFESHVETSNGDPRFLNTRLEAIKTIAGIEVPAEINLNSKVEHDFKIMLEMDDDKLEEMAALARLKQQGVLAIDHKEDPIDVSFSQVESKGPEDVVPRDLQNGDAGPKEDFGDLRRDRLGDSEVSPEEG